MSRARVLFIDAYDSFSNNIVSLLETRLDVSVSKISIDDSIADLGSLLDGYAAVVVGPGPGNPNYAEDVGLMRHIWHLADDHVLPVLGVCLGFQSLVLEFGGTVTRLAQPRHGIENRVTSRGADVFEGLPRLNVVQYHSFHGQLGHVVVGEEEDGAEDMWRSSPDCPELVPLAWDFDRDCTEDGRDRDNPKAVLMAVRHRERPFWAVQFHPESICSSEGARQIVVNWWRAAQDWNRSRGRLATKTPRSGTSTPPATTNTDKYERLRPSSVRRPPAYGRLTPPIADTNGWVPTLPRQPPTPGAHGTVLQYDCLDAGNLTVPTLCSLLRLDEGESIVLDSERRPMPRLGVHSVIGLLSAETLKIVYRVGSQHVQLHRGDETVVQSLRRYGGSIFSFLKAFMEDHRLEDHPGPQESPFWGGLMGYVTYEACLETIDVHLKSPPQNRPDLCFAFVERSIVVNHATRKVYVQSIGPDDRPWILETARMLRRLSWLPESRIPSASPHPSDANTVHLPSESTYHEKIRSCQAEIRAGNSYELCLTDQTVVAVKDATRTSPWSRYLRLRSFNPAPFSAYIRLGPLTVLSTSPERFMSWTRPAGPSHGVPAKDSVCQFRPIKGTVKKRQPTVDGGSRTVSLAEATSLLSSQKERAENLMIVDLIRHDLHGVVGAGNVETKALMVVEEYEHVYQLVTVIEGTLRAPADDKPHRASNHSDNSNNKDNNANANANTNGNGNNKIASSQAGYFPAPPPPDAALRTGIDVLAASLPPGSMTGAPKKRSCELLAGIEAQRPRSVYSGVIGYMDVGGAGDFSVVIRTAFAWDDERGADDGAERWRIGAGGAVTGLSTEQGEWDEMLAKLESILGFWGGAPV